MRFSKPAFLQVEHELGDRRVNGLLQIDHARVAVFVRVPVLKGNVFGGDLDEAGARFGQPPRQQAAQAEAAGVVFVVAGFGFERQIEGLGGRRTQQPVRIIQRAQQRIFLVIAAQLADRALLDEFPVKFGRAFRIATGSFPPGGRTLLTASSGLAMMNGPYSLPRKPAV